MKKLLVLLLAIFTLSSCKNEIKYDVTWSPQIEDIEMFHLTEDFSIKTTATVIFQMYSNGVYQKVDFPKHKLSVSYNYKKKEFTIYEDTDIIPFVGCYVEKQELNDHENYYVYDMADNSILLRFSKYKNTGFITYYNN